MEESKEEEISSPQERPSNSATAITVKVNIKAIVVIVALLGVLTALYYFRGFFVAALVNGGPISRLSVLQELENQSGKQALDSLIIKKLVTDEAKKKGITASVEEINKEIKDIEENISKQGGTLSAFLEQQGMTQERLREQIALRKQIEKILSDKITVSDAEIDAYIKDNKIAPAKDEKIEDMKNSLKEQLAQEKFGKEADAWIAALRSSAKIQYIGRYQ